MEVRKKIELLRENVAEDTPEKVKEERKEKEKDKDKDSKSEASASYGEESFNFKDEASLQTSKKMNNSKKVCLIALLCTHRVLLLLLLLVLIILLLIIGNLLSQLSIFCSLLFDHCFLFSNLLLQAIMSGSHEEDQACWVAFPTCRGELDGEVGGREEGEDNGGDVVAAVVHALAEPPHYLLES